MGKKVIVRAAAVSFLLAVLTSGGMRPHDVLAQANPSGGAFAGAEKAEASPERPTLPPEIAAEVARIQEHLDALLNRGEGLDEAGLRALLTATQQVVSWRTQYQGETWWETITARQNLTDLRHWASLSPEDRAAWAEAAQLDRQAKEKGTTQAYAQALVLHQKVLAVRERLLGPDHPDIAVSLNNLARLYAQGASGEALPLFQRALAIREKALGPDHPDTATSLNNLAGLYQDQGALAEARSLYQRALAIQERALGPDPPEHGDEPQQPGAALQGAGGVCPRVAAVSAGAGDHREGAGPRASNHGYHNDQSGPGPA